MQKLQQIIGEMKDEKLRASKESKYWGNEAKVVEMCAKYIGYEEALSLFIPMLESLLNEQPEAITGGSHFCKHDVGGSTANKETTSLVNDQSDTPSETQAVGGNKQMQEVCPKCGQLMTVIRYGCSCEEEDD